MSITWVTCTIGALTAASVKVGLRSRAKIGWAWVGSSSQDKEGGRGIDMEVFG